MASAEGTTQSVEKVQVNFATEKELRTLHGVGSAISKAIVELRGKEGNLCLESLALIPFLCATPELIEAMDFSPNPEYLKVEKMESPAPASHESHEQDQMKGILEKVIPMCDEKNKAKEVGEVEKGKVGKPDLSLPPPNKNVGNIKAEMKEGPTQGKGAIPKVKENQGTGQGIDQGHQPKFSSGAPGESDSEEGSGPGLYVGQGHHPQFANGAPGGSGEGFGPGLGQGHHPQFANGAPGGSGEGFGPGLGQGHHPQFEKYTSWGPNEGQGYFQGHHPQFDNGAHWGHTGGNYFNPQFQGPTPGVGAGNVFPGHHMGYPPYGAYPGAGAGYGPGYPKTNPYYNASPYVNPNMPGHYPGFPSGAPPQSYLGFQSGAPPQSYPGFQSGAPPQSYPGFQSGAPPQTYPGWDYRPPTGFQGGYPGYGTQQYPVPPTSMSGGANWGSCQNEAWGNTQVWREPEGGTAYDGGPSPYNTSATQDGGMTQYQNRTPPTQDRGMANNQNTNTFRANQRGGHIDSMPKTLKFNGKDDWDAFKLKFTSYALAKQWTPAQCREYLCWCLEGKASEFYTAALKRDAGIEMHDLMQKMERRFGKSELPETAQVRLGTLHQEPDENLESWGDRVQSVALQAFGNLPEEYIRKQVIYRICHGCSDKEAGQHVVNLHIDNIQDAIDRIKHFQYNHRAIFDNKSKEVKEVRCTPMVDLDSNVDGPEPEDMLFKAAKVGAFDKPNLDVKMDKRVAAIENQLGDLCSQLRAIGKKLDDNMYRERSRFPATSPDRRRSRSPSASDTCFHCGGQGHFKANCPALNGNNKPNPKVRFASPAKEIGSRE